EAAPPQSVKSGDGGRRQRAAQPDRVAEPVENADNRSRKVSVREAHPVVGGAFGRKSCAQFGGQQPIRDQKSQPGDDEPEDRLPSERRRLPDRVQRHDGADRKEDHVEPEERLFELALLSNKLSYGSCLPHPYPPRLMTQD